MGKNDLVKIFPVKKRDMVVTSSICLDHMVNSKKRQIHWQVRDIGYWILILTAAAITKDKNIIILQSLKH